MLFQKIIPSDPVPAITPEVASECYSALQNRNTVSESFRMANRFYFDHLEKTMDEARRLEDVVMNAMTSQNQPQTKEELRALMSSDLLDCDIVLQDIIDYVLTYEENTTREDFLSQFPLQQQ